MTTQIDRVGTFRARIVEAGIQTSKAGMPQFVAQFQAMELWCEDKDLMAHFGIAEPGWVDWSGYDQSTMAYLQLVYDKKNAAGEKTGEILPMFHIESLQKALSWDGTSFSTLGSTDWTDKVITIWVEENEYNGKVSLKVDAIDAYDASPHRGGVRAVDANELKALDAKFAVALAGVASSGPTVAPSKAPAKAPSKAVKSKAAPAAPATPPTKADVPAPAATAVDNTSSMTKDAAWGQVSDVNGKSDDERGQAWLKACSVIIPDGDEAKATDEQWAAVAASACADLGCPF